ncbi:ATP-binding protein [Streptomyces sp. NPDC004284]|uniref:ATP-binding protein n=1 Tax=Streptomyces sp. NPDC004284 TaxID=3364695 RepID=UPI00367B9322
MERERRKRGRLCSVRRPCAACLRAGRPIRSPPREDRLCGAGSAGGPDIPTTSCPHRPRTAAPPTGCSARIGKTHITQALGHLAVRQGANVRFTETSRILAELAGGHADRTWDKRIRETSACES